MKESILVIAFKFNDVLYAAETKEFNASKHKVLIVCSKSVKPEDFPLINSFDEVLHFKFNQSSKVFNTFEFLLFLIRFKKRMSLFFKYLFISQPFMLINQIIIKYLKPTSIILIEDGLMNYENYVYPVPALKRILHKLIGIDNNYVLKKITKSYLLNPDLATFKFGKVKQLNLSGDKFKIDPNLINKLKNKKFLFGINLYPNLCGEDEYFEIVSTIMDKFDIDYYVPHTLENFNNQILTDKIFYIKDLGITFEYLATKCEFQIFSFGSSLLFTTKCVNPRNKSFLIKIKHFDVLSITTVLEICDEIYDYSQISDM